MKKATSKQLVEYANRMQQIVRRTKASNHFLQVSAAGLPLIIAVEVTYLQLRHILELIATALLVVNKDAVSVLSDSRMRSWHALDILKAIEIVNDEFYPKPSKKGKEDKDGIIPLTEVKGDFLTKDKFITLYNRCGEVLHTRNPFAKKPSILLESSEDCARLLRQANQWQARIVRLLTHHEFRLKGDNTLYIAHTVGKDHVFHVAEFEPITSMELRPDRLE